MDREDAYVERYTRCNHSGRREGAERGDKGLGREEGVDHPPTISCHPSISTDSLIEERTVMMVQ